MSIEESYPLWDPREDRFDRAIEWLLIAMLAFAPLAFGVVEAWSEEIVLALAAAISIVFCVKVLALRKRSVTWSWSYVPILVFVAMAGAQLIPLPTSVIRLISPQAAETKVQLLTDLPYVDSVASSMTLSFYPHATWHDLRLILAVAAGFAVVFNVFRRPAGCYRRDWRRGCPAGSGAGYLRQ